MIRNNTPKTHTVSNGEQHDITVKPEAHAVRIEIATDTAIVGITFKDANLLHAIAGVLHVEASMLANRPEPIDTITDA